MSRADTRAVSDADRPPAPRAEMSRRTAAWFRLRRPTTGSASIITSSVPRSSFVDQDLGLGLTQIDAQLRMAPLQGRQDFWGAHTGASVGMTPSISGPVSSRPRWWATATRSRDAASLSPAAWQPRLPTPRSVPPHPGGAHPSPHPGKVSRSLICMDSAGWVTAQASAARPKCRCSASAPR